MQNGLQQAPMHMTGNVAGDAVSEPVLEHRRKVLIVGPSAAGKTSLIYRLETRWWTADMDRMINSNRAYDRAMLEALYDRVVANKSDIIAVSVLRPFLSLLAEKRRQPGWSGNFYPVIYLRLSTPGVLEERLRKKPAGGRNRPGGHIDTILSLMDDVDSLCHAVADIVIDVDRMTERQVARAVARHCKAIFRADPAWTKRPLRIRHGSPLRRLLYLTLPNTFRNLSSKLGRSAGWKKEGPSVVSYLSREKYDQLTKAIGGAHWSSAGSRWAYHNLAVTWAKELNLSSPDAALEMGPMGVTVVNDARTMDYDAGANNKDWLIAGYKPTYVHDARSLPWPLQDKEYELVVALRVFHHLVPKQREAFLEAKRVSQAMILVVPTKSVHQNGIDREQLVEWNGGVAPDAEHHYPGQLGSAYFFKW